MRHDDAIQLLDDYLSESLGPGECAELEEHLDGCADCRAWLDDYRLFAAALAGEAEHPTSDQLARRAVESELVEPSEQAWVGEHLEECGDCRRQLELTARAVAGARERPRRWSVFGGASPLPKPVAVRLALAASLLLVVTLGFVLWPSAGPSTAGNGAQQDLVLSADDLQGSRVVEAPGSVTAESVIESGAEVVIRAGETVVLANGFSVSSGASLVVEAGGPAAESTDSDEV